MDIKKGFILLLLLLPVLCFASPSLVDLPRDSYDHLKLHGLTFKVQVLGEKMVTLKVSEKDLATISSTLHHHNKRCGGFVTRPLKNKYPMKKGWDDNHYPIQYKINRAPLVQKSFQAIDEAKLLATMNWFASYHTRYYTAPEGIKAMKDLKKHWSKMTENRSDVSVELFNHKDWLQPSVLLTFKGQTDENIILGGHGDSINTDDEGPHSHAPGFDDNASGIAVMTEIIRVMVQTNYKPKHNIQFMAFAAEEVGLRGSMDITAKYDAEVVKVRGMLNLDGTNYKGSTNINFAILSDNTDKEQNQFLVGLIDTYLKLPWGYEKCHYACSDHYSFNYRNFRASFPAQALGNDQNPRFHTADDTIDVTGGDISHSVSFTKLGLSYLIELDR